jgi:hypothetical protein
MGALDLSRAHEADTELSFTHALLQELTRVFSQMDAVPRMRVIKRIACSGALPVSRDTCVRVFACERALTSVGIQTFVCDSDERASRRSSWTDGLCEGRVSRHIPSTSVKHLNTRRSPAHDSKDDEDDFYSGKETVDASCASIPDNYLQRLVP